MHESSMNLMSDLLYKFVERTANLKVLDVGSFDVNGTYRCLMSSTWEYTGLDIQEGLNVDLVEEGPYEWGLLDNSYDVVISGQCLEHVEAPWLWIKELSRVCVLGGTVIVIAPWQSPVHRYPVDCWRILPDGMKYLLTYAGLTTTIVGKELDDCYGVAEKRKTFYEDGEMSNIT